MKKEYTGACYIGVVGAETEIGECYDSILGIERQPDDVGIFFNRATKGYDARQAHFRRWINDTECPFMLLLDGDMLFPKHTLERLRSHKLPYVSGFYMRRRYNPIAPVWFEPFDEFPSRVWTAPIEPGNLYEIGGSGWGCVLIHRDVAAAVQEIIKDEQFVIEDDMDVWPYDLKKVMEAIHGMRKAIDGGASRDEVKPFLAVLESEIRPLRGVQDVIGSDIRFPFFARKAGFPMWGDSGVQCGHMINYPVAASDFIALYDIQGKMLQEGMEKDYQKELAKLTDRLAELGAGNG